VKYSLIGAALILSGTPQVLFANDHARNCETEFKSYYASIENTPAQSPWGALMSCLFAETPVELRNNDNGRDVPASWTLVRETKEVLYEYVVGTSADDDAGTLGVAKVRVMTTAASGFGGAVYDGAATKNCGCCFIAPARAPIKPGGSLHNIDMYALDSSSIDFSINFGSVGAGNAAATAFGSGMESFNGEWNNDGTRFIGHGPAYGEEFDRLIALVMPPALQSGLRWKIGKQDDFGGVKIIASQSRVARSIPDSCSCVCGVKRQAIYIPPSVHMNRDGWDKLLQVEGRNEIQIAPSFFPTLSIEFTPDQWSKINHQFEQRN